MGVVRWWLCHRRNEGAGSARPQPLNRETPAHRCGRAPYGKGQWGVAIDHKTRERTRGGQCTDNRQVNADIRRTVVKNPVLPAWSVFLSSCSPDGNGRGLRWSRCSMTPQFDGRCTLGSRRTGLRRDPANLGEHINEGEQGGIGHRRSVPGLSRVRDFCPASGAVRAPVTCRKPLIGPGVSGL